MLRFEFSDALVLSVYEGKNADYVEIIAGNGDNEQQFKVRMEKGEGNKLPYRQQFGISGTLKLGMFNGDQTVNMGEYKLLKPAKTPAAS